MYLPPKRPIKTIWNKRIKNGQCTCINKKVHCFDNINSVVGQCSIFMLQLAKRQRICIILNIKSSTFV